MPTRYFRLLLAALVVLALTVVLCAVAYLAGVPMRWVPLVLGGGLGLLAAVAAT